MRKYTILVPATLLAMGLVGCAGSAASGQQAEPQTKPAAANTPEPEPSPNPDARFTGSCDYTLPMNIDGDYKLIGDVDGKNVGNVGVKVKATIKWQQMGYDPIIESETVKLKPGQSKTLHFNETVSGVVIDRIQSYEMNHMSGSLCKFDAVIVDTFGQPQG